MRAATCPKCGFEGETSFEECPRCGVILARVRPGVRRKVRPRESSTPSLTPPPPALEQSQDPASDDGLYSPPIATLASPATSLAAARAEPVDEAGRRAFLVGTLLASGIYLFPFTRFVLSYLIVIIHEMGHAVTSWLFGYGAIPTFDFLYGGGITFDFGRTMALLVLVFVGYAALAFFWRSYPKALALVIGLAVVHAIVAFTPLHRMLITAMGHGAELLVCSVFYYRALSGSSIASPQERPLYAMCAVFINLHNLVFSYRLVSSAIARQAYEGAKGGGHWMDFSRLADDHLHVDLTVVACAFLLAMLLPLVGAWLYLLNRGKVVALLTTLFD